jgi:hypothetical protein
MQHEEQILNGFGQLLLKQGSNYLSKYIIQNYHVAKTAVVFTPQFGQNDIKKKLHEDGNSGTSNKVLYLPLYRHFDLLT